MSEVHHGNYVKIWVYLIILLAVSVIGPMFEIQWLTLITAFGIAGVKAYMVLSNFMHIHHVPKFITYTVVTCLVFMVLFFAGTAPDVMNDQGQNWKKPIWLEEEADFEAGHGQAHFDKYHPKHPSMDGGHH